MDKTLITIEYKTANGGLYINFLLDNLISKSYNQINIRMYV